MAPILEVHDLTFRYAARPRPAVQGITFSVEEGEMLLIAGPSGCGKSTLLRALNGLIPRSYRGELQGAIRIGGVDPRTWPLARLSQQVGTLLQDPERQIVAADVLHDVAFGLENLGWPRARILERVDEVLHALGIAHLRDRPTFQLSGGEKQRVALAGVLAMAPRILLLDEPLASLDPQSAQDALALFRQLHQEGHTVLLVEHRVEDAMKARPNRVLYLEEGRLAFDGDPEAFFERVDPTAVKVPFPVWLRRWPAVRERGKPAVEIPPADPTAPSLVVFENVSFGYGDGPDVVREVHAEIRRGDSLAILGPNGAGKTTLLKLAMGLLKPRRGRVWVGRKTTREQTVAEIAHIIGYVFQSPSQMLFAPTVWDEVAFGPRNLGQSPEQIETHVRWALELVGLLDQARSSPWALSFGQQKRVTIASVLSMRSRILVMDEPTAGQDYRAYMQLMDAIAEIAFGPTRAVDALVFITHDLDLALSFANRVWVVADGRLIADGPPEIVFSDPEVMRRGRLVPTSLLEANRQHWTRTGRFQRAERLAELLQGTPPAHPA
ncbi:Putative HMP/thiamine import ATP-binding protein YkoD [Candidatus Thermoflexus japonica]|uniref:HMP/thiamine import ATP-binding protein YkoD n=1 Tax=Candidatus Thermoflexus japonica TaxID=2035417 RepID=A0A2H5Y7W8_9CHLR|nr:Putative HMP/thiamine import ATP-binding protein YkoD [Candidatus Thermoflexus japonica]